MGKTIGEQLPEGPLRDRHWEAIALLAEGMTRKEVAKLCGISDRTIYNWLQIPEFQDELSLAIIQTERARRAERMRQAREVAGGALAELAKRLKDPEERDNLTARELKDIYRDVISTMLSELKSIPMPAPKEEAAAETTDRATGDVMDNETFRKDLRELLKRYN